MSYDVIASANRPLGPDVSEGIDTRRGLDRKAVVRAGR
jgi:hypothetical protein